MTRALEIWHRAKQLLGLTMPPIVCSACGRSFEDARVLCGPSVYLCEICAGDALARLPDAGKPGGA